MTVAVLVTGEIFRAAKQQTSKAGKLFTVATMKAAATDASNSEFWSLLAFSESAQQELLRLAVGEKLSVQGGLKLEHFIRDDGEIRISRTIFANLILALRQPPKERKPKPSNPRPPERPPLERVSNPVNITHNVAVFMSSPLYLELERMLINTLSDHPDVLAKVVDGLRQLEERTPMPEYTAGELAGPTMRDVTPHAA